MAILVTGAGGFVGRALVGALSAQGRGRIVAVDSRFGSPMQGEGVEAVEADLTDPAAIAQICVGGIEAVIHLAAVPGGAAEADPLLSRRVNVDATSDLIETVAKQGSRPRFVFASTIAVFGDPLPAEGVDDDTPLRPRLIYGAHKAMVETLVATMSRRGAINGISLRLPGVVARPKGPSGLKSAFMSDLFHALAAGEAFTSPVSEAAALWLMSVEQCAQNLVHALDVDEGLLPPSRAMTLPALRVTMADLAAAVAAATGADPALVGYAPDAALEAAFGAHPPLSTALADTAGFRHDGQVGALVAQALQGVRKS